MVPTFDSLTVARFLHDRLQRGRPAALVVVASGEGSAPGAPGFMMAVDAGGEACGTIGGGAIEFRMTNEARRAARDPSGATELRRFAHRESAPPGAEVSDLLCGGDQTVLLRACGPADLPAIGAWASGAPGRLTLVPDALRFAPDAPGPAGVRFREDPGGTWAYEEDRGRVDTVHIFGGGHVGQALARVLATLPLRIAVVEPRADVGAPLAELPAVERVSEPYAAAAERLPEGADRYVVIATPGHAFDYDVLRAVVRKDLRYLGLLGSRRKAALFRERLAAEGVDADRIARVRSPAGLPVGSHTPAEIAISIAAEIVAVRNGVPAGAPP